MKEEDFISTLFVSQFDFADVRARAIADTISALTPKEQGIGAQSPFVGHSVMQLITRKATVRWVASAHCGAGAVTTDSGTLARVPFSSGHVRRRKSNTDSAELIAAAHAVSFAQALAGELGKKALRAGEILVSATVTLERLAAGWTITNIHLNVVARLSHLSQVGFIDATLRAKTNCVASQALRPTVSMNARLEKMSRRRTGQTSRANSPTAHRPSVGRRTQNR